MANGENVYSHTTESGMVMNAGKEGWTYEKKSSFSKEPHVMYVAQHSIRAK